MSAEKFYLKSNMDRFIGNATEQFDNNFADLKSNMDRFIAEKLSFPHI